MIDAIIVTSTVIAAPVASPLMNARFMMYIPSREITTVKPGEHDGSPGGVDRDHRGLLGILPGFQTFAVSGDDEQRVVDADAEADHRAERGGEVGDRHHVRQQRDDAGADADTEQRDSDRQTHGQDRAEGEDQHDDRERDADQLGFGRLELAERLATDLDLETFDVGGNHADDVGADLSRLRLGQVLGQVDLSECHQAGEVTLGRDLSTSHALLGIRAGESDTRNLRDLVEQIRHRGLHLGIVHALIGAEDDRARPSAAGATEVLVQRVESALRFGVGDRERAVARRTDRSDECENCHEDRDPRTQHEPATAEAEPAETCPHRRTGGRRRLGGERCIRGGDERG